MQEAWHALDTSGAEGYRNAIGGILKRTDVACYALPLCGSTRRRLKDGIIPEDEVVSPLDVMDFEDGKLGFPFDPFRKTLDNLWTFINNKHLRNFCTIHTRYSKCAAGGVVSFCLAYVREGVLLGIGGCLSGSRLPVPEYEISDGLAQLDVESQLSRYVNGRLKPLLAPQVVAKLRKFDWPKEWHFDEADGVHPVIEFSTRRTRK